MLLSLLVSILSVSHAQEAISVGFQPLPVVQGWARVFYPESSSFHWIHAGQPVNVAADPALQKALQTGIENARERLELDSWLKPYAGCDRVVQLLQKTSKGFFRGDFETPGKEQIIYADYSPCSEAWTTATWTREGTTWRLARLQTGLVVALNATGEKIEFEPASGGGRETTLSLRTAANKNLFPAVFHQDTLQPEPLPHRNFVAQKRLILRHHPEIKDQYDANQSQRNGSAVFGNQVLRFLPGAKGRIIGGLPKYPKWVYVWMNEDSRALRDYHPEGTSLDSGWVERKSLPLIR